MDDDKAMKIEAAIVLAIVLLGLVQLARFGWHSLAGLF